MKQEMVTKKTIRFSTLRNRERKEEHRRKILEESQKPLPEPEFVKVNINILEKYMPKEVILKAMLDDMKMELQTIKQAYSNSEVL